MKPEKVGGVRVVMGVSRGLSCFNITDVLTHLPFADIKRIRPLLPAG